MNYDELSIDELGKELIKQVKEQYVAEQKVTDMNKSIGALNSILAQRMEDKEVPMFAVGEHKLEYKLDETFSIDKDVTDSTWNDEDGAFMIWLKEVGEEGIIKAKPSVHNATREKFLKDRLAKKLPLPEFIKTGFFKRVKYNASAIKKDALGE